MKMLNAIRIALLGSIGLILLTVSLRVAAQPNSRMSFQIFYDQLAPYGEWVRDPQHGYIWIPDVDYNFMPYSSNGHWVLTQYGNMWVSDYPWGWAAFHYGRWVHDDWYGWAWVPGYEWGPAWVSWRNGGGYYGWAPLGPGMHISINVRIPAHHWIFVPQKYVSHRNVHRYMVPRSNRVVIYNRTTIINNIYVKDNRRYVSGPSRAELERATRKRMNVRNVKHASRPERARVDSRSVSIYRPAVDERSRLQARPKQASDLNVVKERSQANRNGVRQSSRPGNTVQRSAERPQTRAGVEETRRSSSKSSQVRTVDAPKNQNRKAPTPTPTRTSSSRQVQAEKRNEPTRPNTRVTERTTTNGSRNSVQSAPKVRESQPRSTVRNSGRETVDRKRTEARANNRASNERSGERKNIRTRNVD